jgi:hypothetical protein
VVVKLACDRSPESLLALGGGSGARLLEMVRTWKKEVPGTLLLLPDDPYPAWPDTEGPVIQVRDATSISATGG